ncbi:RAD52 motif-containing protein 1 isoform X3 [Dendrobates tinctorius]|uniref:RAD52 motif-containing protein 1 isoform X3 n=1 Tax=Dendrobates tinctorius TaxID=92724 RepID=UPI003CCA40EC
MEAEVVSFTIPVESNKIVFVWNIAAQLPEAVIYVQICVKQKGFPYKSLELYGHKCQVLANYYLGFNGWSKRIIAMQNISGLDHDPEEESELQEPSKLRYLCVVQVTLPYHGVCSRGVGVAEEIIDKENNPLEFISKTEKVQKFSQEKALCNAFQKLLLVIFDSGKVAVEYVAGEDDTVDCLTEEELQRLIQVNDFTWTRLDPGGGEDEDWAELTCHEDTLIVS